MTAQLLPDGTILDGTGRFYGIDQPAAALRNGEATDPAERFKLYRLCACFDCSGTGKNQDGRCPDCRGEGRVKELVASCATPQDVGVALVTLGREGEFADCPFGLLDSLGETGLKWLVSPWLPSPRNVSDAGRVLAKSKGDKQ